MSTSAPPPLAPATAEPASPGAQAQGLMEQVLHASTKAVVITGAAEPRIIVYVNPAFERITGYTRTAALGQTKQNLLCPPRDPEVWQAIERAASEGDVFHGIAPAHRKDGTRFFADVDFYPIRDASGVVTHWVLTFDDASERVELEAALLQSEAQHRLLADNLRDLITVHRPRDGQCLYASPSARQLLNCEPVELIGASLHDFFDGEYLVQARRIFRDHGAGKSESTFTHRLRRKDGSLIWAETTSKTRYDQDGAPEIVSITRDISLRKEAENSLTAMHGLLSSVYEAVPVGLCLADADGYVQLCNRAFATLFGREPSELAGESIEKMLSPTKLAEATGEPGTFITDETRTGQGRVVPIEISVAPVRFAEESWKLVTLKDLTERVQIEHRLREVRQLESLGTLAGGVAHDFNNLLTIILGYAGLLRERLEDPAGAERAISAILEAGQRGADVVRQLQLFANQHEIEPLPTDLHALLDETLDRLAAEWPAKIRVERDFAALDPIVPIDGTQIVQGLQHLVQNAIQAMERGGTLTIRTADCGTDHLPGGEHHAGIKLTIEDTGRGMDASTRARIFEPFFAKDKGPAVRGLGLAVVYGIMRAHRGHIEVDSAPGEGTRVHLCFPRQVVTPESLVHPGQVTPTTSPPSAARPTTVLVVEDEEDIGRLWQSIFAAESISMLWARSGEEALQIFADHKTEIGLLFSDIGLPGIDGWEVAKRIRAERPLLPLVLASGAFKPGDREESNLGSPVVCLPKPFPPSEIVARIRTFLQLASG